MWVTLLLALAAAAAAVGAWFFLTRNTSYWQRRGLPHLRPELLFGNVKALVLLRQSCAEGSRDFYRLLDGHPMGGLYFLWRPVLLVRDPDIAGRILTDDFDSFRDRGFQAPDPLLQDLFSLQGGHKWETLRASLEPGFGPKGARHVFFLIDEMAERLVNVMESAAKRQTELNAFDHMQRFVIDAIGTCAFGVEFGSMTNANSFVMEKTKQISTGSIIREIKKKILLVVPDTARLMGFSFLRPADETVFRWLASEIVRHRRRYNVRRNDLIHLLMGLAEQVDGPAKDKNVGLDGEMFAAQVFMLLMLGRLKVANTLAYCLHELAVHPEAQNRARLQVDGVMRRHSGEVTLDAVQEMTYLDMVISEALRMHPPMSSITRTCTAPYKFPATTNKGDGCLNLAPGEAPLYVPIYALHRDHNYFPNPECFDPDRFSAERAANHRPYTYLPFGAGRRKCLGERLAVLLMKTTLARLLSKYELFPSSRTQYPAPIDVRGLMLQPKDGLWVKISHRHWLPCE